MVIDIENALTVKIYREINGRCKKRCYITHTKAKMGFWGRFHIFLVCILSIALSLFVFHNFHVLFVNSFFFTQGNQIFYIFLFGISIIPESESPSLAPGHMLVFSMNFCFYKHIFPFFVNSTLHSVLSGCESQSKLNMRMVRVKKIYL
jgi:hypothetical protein